MASLSAEFGPLRDMMQVFAQSLKKQEQAFGDTNIKLQADFVSNSKIMFEGFAEGLKTNLLKELTNVLEKEHHPVKEEHKRLHKKVTSIAQISHETRVQQDVLQKYLEELSRHSEEFLKTQESLKDLALQNRQLIFENEQKDEATRREVEATRELSQANRDLSTKTIMRLAENEREDELTRRRLEQNEKRDTEYVKRLEENERHDAENLQRLVFNEQLDEEYRKRMQENEERDQMMLAKLAEYQHGIQDQELKAKEMFDHMDELKKQMEEAEDDREDYFEALQAQLAEATNSRNTMLENIEQMKKMSVAVNADTSSEVEKLRQQLQAITLELEDSKKHTASVLTDKLKFLRELEERGNLAIDLKSGEVELKRQINYVPKMPADGPVAQYASEMQALSVVQDIADLWKLFQVEMTVEGHTKDLQVGPDEFWQQLADNRAALCVNSLRAKGVDTAKVVARGRPGKKGLNTVCVVVKLDIFPNL